VKASTVVTAVAPVLAASLTLAATARAGGDDVATAQVLFDDGKRLMAQERWSDACPKLQESQRLAPAIGTEYNLADCLEHQGKLASSWAAFLDVVDQTHKRGEAQREAAAKARAAAIAPKLGKLTIQVPIRAPGLEVLRDGVALPPEVWGVAVPVDAGDHRVEARAPGRTSWTSTVRTADAATATTNVPDLVPAPVVPPPPDTTTGPAPSSSSPGSAPPQLAPVSADHTAALIVLGSAVVLAGVGVAGVLEHASNVSNYNADPSCPSIDSSTRPAQCDDYVNQANTWNTVGIVGFVAGGAALVTGITLWLLAPSHAAAISAASGLVVGCAPGPGTVGCTGAF
jgi:hypothetical protein